MEKRKAKIIFNKSGSGSITRRVTLPNTWVDDLGISPEEREVNIIKLRDRIIIIKGDLEMNKDLIINQVIEECKNEIKRVGYICDSDNVERFVDVEARKAIESLSSDDDLEDNINDYFDEICEHINDYLKATYKKVGYCDNGDYVGYYFLDGDFRTVEELENKYNIGK